MKMIFKICFLVLPLLAMAKEVNVEQLFSVTTVKVKKQTISNTIKNYGYVKADESKKFIIAPRFGGYVVKLFANRTYTKVKKGEALAKIYSPEVLKAKDEYLNTFKYTKKRPNKSMLESAKLKLKLLNISDKEISKITKEKKTSPNTTIYSPVDGYVFVKNISNGSAFKTSDVLFEIVNLETIWVEMKLFEEQRKQLSKAKNFEVSFKGIDAKYKTNKSFIYPELNPKIATMTMRLELNNGGAKLFPGMYANIRTITNTKTKLTLPTTAVIRKDGKFYAFVVGEYEGEYEPLEIEAKIIDAHTYEIISGLSQGDEVVNNALFMMDSDAQINGLY